MANRKSVVVALLGDKERENSDSYFMTITCLTAFFFLMLLCVFHLFLSLKIEPIFLSGVSSLICLGLYFLVRFGNFFFISKLTLTLFGLIFLDLTWYSKFLSNGPVLFFIFAFGALVLWVWEGKALAFLLAFYFLNIAVLFVIDYNAPNYLLQYPNQQTRSVDIFLSFILYFSLMIFLLYIIKRDFIRQKKQSIDSKERALQSESRLNAIFQAVPDIIFIQNRSGVFIHYHAQQINELYKLHNDIVGKHISEILPLEVADKQMAILNLAFETKDIQIFEYQLQLSNGVNFFECKVIAYEEDKVLSISRNITERKIAEAEIKLKNMELTSANSNKDLFITTLAHDLKSPFSALLGLSELLSENIHKYDTDKIENFAKVMHKSARNTFNLLEDLLMWAKVQSGKILIEPQDLSIAKICDDLLEILCPIATDKNILLSCYVSEDNNVYADYHMLKTVMRNLITNAIKFTKNGGQVIVYSEQDPLNVTITVSDNGVGIDSDTIVKLFDIKQKISTKGTADESGSGLGLILCKDLVEKQGGLIWVESEKGKGSEFKFTIPLSKNSLIMNSQKQRKTCKCLS